MRLAVLRDRMSGDRTRTLERATETDADQDASVDAPRVGTPIDEQERRTGTEAGPLAGVRTLAGRLFSPRAFLAALAVTGTGLVAGDAVVPLPAAGMLGVFLATFLFGLLRARRHYAESLVAAGTVVAASTLVGYAVVAAFGGVGVPLVVVAGSAGALVGAVGHYFGRDLREGLTREL
jgi:phage-related tail protein